MIIYKNQSLLDITEGIILHGCNCFCTMGAGVAKLLKDKYPIVFEIDNGTASGDLSKLGNYSIAKVDEDLTILNCYTQYHYGKYPPAVDYEAMIMCFYKIKNDFPSQDLYMPKIGCGLAGGEWEIVEEMIESIFCDRTVFVFYL